MNAIRGICMAARARLVRGPTASGSCCSVGLGGHVSGSTQVRYKFIAPPSYVFGKVHRPVKPVHRIVYKWNKSPTNQQNAVAKMEPYNRETKMYEYRRLRRMDPDERMREAIAERNQKKVAEKERLVELEKTPLPRQQTGEIRNFTHSARKTNAYAKLIRKMSVKQAVEQLSFMQHLKGARVVYMCLMTAVKNAKHNQGIESDNLWVSHSWCGPGAKPRKRIDIRGRGRFGTIKQGKCHYFLVLEEGEPPKKQSKFIPRNLLTRWVHKSPAPFIQNAT